MPTIFSSIFVFFQNPLPQKSKIFKNNLFIHVYNITNQKSFPYCPGPFLLVFSRETARNVIFMNMSKKEWADKLGVQRPSLSRELMNMKKDGLIDYDRKNIKILDLEEIELNK